MPFFSTNNQPGADALLAARDLRDLGFAATLDIGGQYAAEQRRTAQREQLFATTFRQWVRPQQGVSLPPSPQATQPKPITDA